MKKIFKFIIGLLIIAGIAQAMGLIDLQSTTPTQQTTVVEVVTSTISETTVTETTAEETTEEISKELAYDYSEMNSKIIDSFEESVSFHEQGEDGYEWTQYVYEIELQENEAVHVTVEDAFLELNDEDKTFVLNSVSNLVNMEIFLKTEESRPYYVTARDQNGNKVAQSKMLNVLEYEFD